MLSITNSFRLSSVNKSTRKFSNFISKSYMEQEKKLKQALEPNSYYFIREEVQLMTQKLQSNEKGLFILTGPARSGKTQLMNGILKDWTKFTSIQRSLNYLFETNWRLVDFIGKTYNNHLKLMKELEWQIKKAKILKNTIGCGVSNSDLISKLISLKEPIRNYLEDTKCMKNGDISNSEFAEIFNDAIDTHYKNFHGKNNNLVVFFDDFEAVSKSNDPEFVKYLLQFLIKKSREEGKLSVVLGTTDCLLVSKLQKNFNLKSGEYKHLHLGFLSKSDTLKYLKAKNIAEEFHEKIYDVFGGNISEIQKMLNWSKNMSYTEIENFNHSNCYKYLTFTSGEGKLNIIEQKSLISIYRKLVETEWIPKETLDEQYTSEIVDKLISKDLLYLRDGESLTTENNPLKQNKQINLFKPSYKYAVNAYLNSIKNKNNFDQ